MDEETFKTNLETLKEALLDEKKLVTYISLSKDLCIHINESKSLLNTLVEDFKSNQPNTKLNISYLLSGLSDNNVARTTVCSEADLEHLRSNLKIIFFQHVYSVSQGPPITDNAAFVAVSKFEDLPLCIGLIRSNSCTKRTSDEIGNLKLKTYHQDPVIEPVKNSVPKKQVSENMHKDIIKNAQEDSRNILKVSAITPETKIKSEVPSPIKESQNGSKLSNKRNETNNNKPKSIAGFFSKANGSTNKKPNKVDVQATVVKVKIEDNEQESILKEEKEKSQKVDIEKMDVDKGSVKKVPHENTITKKRKSKNSSLREIKKNAKVDNKRKRVLHVADSESDTENDPFADEANHVDHESEDEIPPTPSANTVKITSGIVNPKKKRKIVDKTYTDEEGYILTKKEVIYESCSDQEEEVMVNENVQHVKKMKLEVSPKEKKTKANKKKASPTSHQKAKQPTMMNFFKKM